MSLPRHIPVLDIYVTPPPSPGHVTQNVGKGAETYWTWDFTLGLESSYLWENIFYFETQNDVVSKYYSGIPGNIL